MRTFILKLIVLIIILTAVILLVIENNLIDNLNDKIAIIISTLSVTIALINIWTLKFGYDKIRLIAIDKFENKTNGRNYLEIILLNEGNITGFIKIQNIYKANRFYLLDRFMFSIKKNITMKPFR